MLWLDEGGVTDVGFFPLRFSSFAVKCGSQSCFGCSYVQYLKCRITHTSCCRIIFLKDKSLFKVT